MKDRIGHDCVSVLESATFLCCAVMPRAPENASNKNISIMIYFHIWTQFNSIIGRIGAYPGIWIKTINLPEAGLTWRKWPPLRRCHFEINYLKIIVWYLCMVTPLYVNAKSDDILKYIILK